jgi:hypothetical protein
MARRFMDLPPHKPGYCWQNISLIGEDPMWQEVVAPWIAEDCKLFGYDESTFMAKQYRKKAA